jgi:hypothetical protein
MSYPDTPTLSDEGFQLRLRLVSVTFETERPVGAVGGVVSDVVRGAVHASVAASTEAATERLPAASNASTTIAYVVLQARSEIVAAGSVTVILGEPLTETRYPATPTLSADGDHESDTLVAVREVTLRPVGAVGAWVSAHEDVWT